MDCEYKNTVYTKFYNDIFPQLAKLERERTKELTKFVVLLVISVVFPVFYFCDFGLFLDITERLDTIDENFGLIFILGSFIAAVLVPIFAIQYMVKIKNNFKSTLKKNFTDEICNLFGRLRYVPGDNVMKQDALKKSTLFSMFNAMYPDDSFTGEYKGVKYKISELKLSLDARKGSYTAFKGVIITFNSNKKIKALTTVVTKSDFNSGNGLPLSWIFIIIAMIAGGIWAIVSGGLLDAKITNDSGLLLLYSLPVLTIAIPICFVIVLALIQRKQYTKENSENKNEIRLEDVKFEKRFRVFSDNEVEARYLVTTAFMERFLNMTTAFGTNKAKCAFAGDKIIFAITTGKDLFELGSIFKPLTDTKNIGLLNELMSILEMIDYFKLDEKTGL